MSTSHDISVDVDPGENAAEIRFVEVREQPVRNLFQDDELRLWEDEAGWSGYVIDDGDLYEVNTHHDADGWIRKDHVDPETVAGAIAQHIRDPNAGEFGEFVRGATPP
jgi:hypothetical protein